MGISVDVEMVEDRGNSVVYQFTTASKNGVGTFLFEKKSGEIELIQPHENDPDGVYLIRAHWAIKKRWRKGDIPKSAGFIS